jgi:hypothetical protein
MPKELYANLFLGLLAARSSLYWRRVMVRQYWRSFDHLVVYAQSRDAAHLPAWKAVNQSVGSDGAVGIWHETYQVANGQYACVYANMPRFGLAVAGTHEPATGHLRDARWGMHAPPSKPRVPLVRIRQRARGPLQNLPYGNVLILTISPLP